MFDNKSSRYAVQRLTFFVVLTEMNGIAQHSGGVDSDFWSKVKVIGAEEYSLATLLLVRKPLLPCD